MLVEPAGTALTTEKKLDNRLTGDGGVTTSRSNSRPLMVVGFLVVLLLVLTVLLLVGVVLS